jgi:hypothetical protein
MKLKAGETLDREGFKEYKKRTVAEKSAGVASRQLKAFEEYLQETGIELAAVDIEAFADSLQKKGKPETSVSKLKSVARGYIEYALQRGDLETENDNKIITEKTVETKAADNKIITGNKAKEQKTEKTPEDQKPPVQETENDNKIITDNKTEKPTAKKRGRPRIHAKDNQPPEGKKRHTVIMDIEKYEMISRFAHWQHVSKTAIFNHALDLFIAKYERKAAKDGGKYFDPIPDTKPF